ncbi:hypothetical protein ANCDUO_01299 [Ancylostoma duodenale]|uniref:Uncharacterized protein n=1 Tax=Ancylostoma duodenale TaxID=51022 RepID=A0A0C2H9S8_9BILA|nr:hypothetical protein ANCDUO_01299 [Ancylostoma duodenale]
MYSRIIARTEEFLTNSPGLPPALFHRMLFFLPQCSTYDLADTVLAQGVKCCTFADDWKVYHPADVQDDKEIL